MNRDSNSKFSQGLGSVRDPKIRYVLLPTFFIFIGFLLTRFIGLGNTGSICDESEPPVCKMTNMGILSTIVGVIIITFSSWFIWSHRSSWDSNIMR